MHTALTVATQTFSDLREKQVVNLRDGSVLGCVCDLELSICSGSITALILPAGGIFSSLSSKNRIVIPWNCIECIGKDTILVKADIPKA